MFINFDRGDAGAVRDVAANHEDDAEFAECMRERQHDSRHEATRRHRHGDRDKGVDWRGPQAGRGLHGLFDWAFKGGLKRLDHEWERIDHRSDDQTRKGEAQRIASRLHPKSTKPAIRAHRNQQIEAEHGSAAEPAAKQQWLQSPA